MSLTRTKSDAHIKLFAFNNCIYHMPVDNRPNNLRNSIDIQDKSFSNENYYQILSAYLVGILIRKHSILCCLRYYVFFWNFDYAPRKENNQNLNFFLYGANICFSVENFLIMSWFVTTNPPHNCQPCLLGLFPDVGSLKHCSINNKECLIQR